ncbi:hypothetical protein ITP53_55310 [Nonomuraea sp. K274]|uniref:Secreted protein n=1 Tax=Nonomuraea cypriaca TaxID=1187855 RepID=A0A931F459_9ACTN|nr:hypothetical protein [Nonomuraea cypriaca]MBF8194674.1 hypothetical protein [Nonomuraea cypriaca]
MFKPPIRSLLAGGLLVVAVFGAATPALAATFQVKHGQNVAVTSLTDKEVTLCDGENDGYAVQVQYERASGNGGAFWESRGSGACATSGSGTVITRMKVCEQRSLGADNCTGWVTNPNLGFAPPVITEEDLRREAEDPYMYR